MSIKILIIEDEKSIQHILKAFLIDAGYEVCLADNGLEGISAFHKDTYDLVLLDIMMPRVDGYIVCEMIRNESKIPIILLTALDDDESQMKGFDLLADDYITKPFSMPLVLRRIEAVLRRTRNCNENPTILTHKEIQLDTEKYKVFVSGSEVGLTAREFEILRLLLENKGRVFTRDNLLNQIWNYHFLGDEKIVNTHIKNIRKKLEVDCIETIRGVGYRIDKKD
ncbi:response regulator transcription factor [Gorillibacterium timonense]|uniref:response regulator transcription factor n=1 Tax=Gorillibacterium timonense TaxID=1689269 RepID=UPI000D527197|nr:response regulator transcription factor [Gorillibacterium timonense]